MTVDPVTTEPVTIFGATYAGLYEAAYADLPAAPEVEGILTRWREFRTGLPRTALDVGCGTGRHCRVLSGLGVHVTGVDPSPGMLDVARANPGPPLEYLSPAELADRIDDSAPGTPAGDGWDLVYSLGHVLSYQADPAAPAAFLSDLAARTAPGGLVIVDCWHLAGMVKEPPSTRTRSFTLPVAEPLPDSLSTPAAPPEPTASLMPPTSVTVHRTATPTVDWVAGVTRVDIEVRSDPAGLVECREVHMMRAFTSTELRLLCRLSGLTPLAVRGARDPAQTLTDSDWHALLIAAPAD